MCANLEIYKFIFNPKSLTHTKVTRGSACPPAIEGQLCDSNKRFTLHF